MKNQEIISKDVFYNESEYYDEIQQKHQGKGCFISWNWAGFLFSHVWLIYRRCYLAAFLTFLVINILSFPFAFLAEIVESNVLIFLASCWEVFLCCIFGMFANSIYLGSIRKKIRSCMKDYNPEESVKKRCRPNWKPVLIFWLALFIIFLIFAFFVGALVGIAELIAVA